MPLKRGSSKAAISANIKTEIPAIRAKRPGASAKDVQRQAVAIAMRTAGKPKPKGLINKAVR